MRERSVYNRYRRFAKDPELGRKLLAQHNARNDGSADSRTLAKGIEEFRALLDRKPRT